MCDSESKSVLGDWKSPFVCFGVSRFVCGGCHGLVLS